MLFETVKILLHKKIKQVSCYVETQYHFVAVSQSYKNCLALLIYLFERSI